MHAFENKKIYIIQPRILFAGDAGKWKPVLDLFTVGIFILYKSKKLHWQFSFSSFVIRNRLSY